MNNKLTNSGAAQLWIGALVFLLPCLSLVTLFGVSLASFLFLLSGLYFYRQGRAALVACWGDARWVVLAFLFNFGFIAACYVLRPAVGMGSVEKPARMFFAVSALMVVLAVRPSRRALWWGVTGGALAALLLAGWQRAVLRLDRPGGLINAITFGDLALCLALLALVAAVELRDSRRQWMLAALGALAGLGASILSGTRGSWIALALAAPVFARHARLLPGRRLPVLLAAGLALAASAWFVPALGVQARALQGVADLRTWLDGGSAFSAVGIRLELWKGAAMLVAEHPLAGSANYKAEFARLVGEGRLDRVVMPMPHLHNDALQALVTGGIGGLLAWFAILAAPGAFFVRALRAAGGGPGSAPALAGLLLVLCYFGFGLTEVMFWSVKGSLFYALMVFLLTGFCLNAKEEIGK
jgi:O-antigen ligase